MAWIYLLLAGALEIGFTTSMRFTEGFTRPLPTLVFVVCVAASLYFMNQAAEGIPLGTVYAIWGGIGAVGTVALGILYFNEPADLWRMVFLAILIGAIIGLKLVSPH